MESDMEDDIEGDMESDILASAITKLTELRILELDVFNDFSDTHLITIASSLTNLEAFSVLGSRFSNIIWPALSTLHSLRKLVLSSQDGFNFYEVLEYIDSLGAGNRGLELCIGLASSNRATCSLHKVVVSGALLKKVGGQLDCRSR